MDVDADIAVGRELGLARVNADAKPHCRVWSPRLPEQRTLDLGGSLHRVSRAFEDHENAVAGQVHLVATVLCGRVTHELARPRAHLVVPLSSECVEEPR